MVSSIVIINPNIIILVVGCFHVIGLWLYFSDILLFF